LALTLSCQLNYNAAQKTFRTAHIASIQKIMLCLHSVFPCHLNICFHLSYLFLHSSIFLIIRENFWQVKINLINAITYLVFIFILFFRLFFKVSGICERLHRVHREWMRVREDGRGAKLCPPQIIHQREDSLHRPKTSLSPHN